MAAPVKPTWEDEQDMVSNVENNVVLDSQEEMSDHKDDTGLKEVDENQASKTVKQRQKNKKESCKASNQN